jgi:Tfp pilus assembly protein PilF
VEKDGTSSTRNAARRKYDLAMTYFKMGERQRGMKAFTAALQIDSKLPEAQMAARVSTATP